MFKLKCTHNLSVCVCEYALAWLSKYENQMTIQQLVTVYTIENKRRSRRQMITMLLCVDEENEKEHKNKANTHTLTRRQREKKTMSLNDEKCKYTK